MRSSYVASLALMLNSLHAAGVRTSYVNLDAAHIADQRDALTHMALQTDATHLLFIDSDMKFPADLAEKYLAFGQPFVGAVYARRKLNLDNVEAALAQHTEFKRALAIGHEFNVKFDSPNMKRQGEFLVVQNIGLGFALIARECFETMAKRLTLRRYPGYYVSGEVVSYFQELTDTSGQRISEDNAFSQRWRECSGTVWGHAYADIKHIGDFAYGMPFASLFAPK